MFGKFNFSKIEWKSDPDDIKIVLIDQFEKGNICNCTCHVEGIELMHCMPCCQLTYHNYLDNEMNLEEDKLYDLLKNLYEEVNKNKESKNN